MELAVGDFTLPARLFGLKPSQNQYLKVKRLSTKKTAKAICIQNMNILVLDLKEFLIRQKQNPISLIVG